MTTIQKIDFQGDELHIYYVEKGDKDKKIKYRSMTVNWKESPSITEAIESLFTAVVLNYFGDSVKFDWDKFMKDVKTYEEKKNDNS